VPARKSLAKPNNLSIGKTHIGRSEGLSAQSPPSSP
jgi:hypothetical protein